MCIVRRHSIKFDVNYMYDWTLRHQIGRALKDAYGFEPQETLRSGVISPLGSHICICMYVGVCVVLLIFILN
jgi:hypothetical protein